MMVRFTLQVAGFGFVYALLLMAAFPFMVYFGRPKPWQKSFEFLMSFPVDNERVGVFSAVGVVAVFFLNGLLWGLVILGTCRLTGVLKSL